MNMSSFNPYSIYLLPIVDYVFLGAYDIPRYLWKGAERGKEVEEREKEAGVIFYGRKVGCCGKGGSYYYCFLAITIMK